MEQRALGTQGLSVSTLGLGCMGMTFAYGGQDDAESAATIHRSIELGCTFFDTADMYGPLTNEELLGDALQGRRDDVVIATKFGNEVSPEGKLTGKVNGRPDYLRGQVEGSLRRLRTDYIDLYYQHRVDPAVPVEETWGAMGELVAEGKVRYLGISEAAPETIRKAHAAAPMSAVQTEYSLWTRDVEDDGVLDAVRELGIGFVPYSPLGRGFLSGTIRSIDDLEPNDRRREHPRFQGENMTANLRLVDEINRLAGEKGVTPSQLALAWVLAQGEDMVPIPGTKRRNYLEQNAAALEVTFTQTELVEIDRIAPSGITQGDRYPTAMMHTVRR